MKLMKASWFVVVFTMFFSGMALANPVFTGGSPYPPALKKNYPERYTVEKGDTLWHISGLYLRNPWQWPRIWAANSHIDNPHLIYPGDVLALTIHQGRPRLEVVNRSPLKLSPAMRASGSLAPIPPVNLRALTHFLDHSLLIEKSDLKKQPYVVEYAQDRLIAAHGDRLYVKNLQNNPAAPYYSAYRLDRPYKDPTTKKFLGYGATHVGDLKLLDLGEPATLQVVRTVREVNIGDRVLPKASPHQLMQFQPHPPSVEVEGRIVSPLEGLKMVSIFQAVVLNRGEVDGLRPGDVLGIYRQNDPRTDQVKSRVLSHKRVQLPPRRIGEMMVFRTFQAASFGLVLAATDFIESGDEIRNP